MRCDRLQQQLGLRRSPNLIPTLGPACPCSQAWLHTLPPDLPAPACLPQVKVTPIPGKRADHQGIRIQLLGEVELASERGHPHQFLSLGGCVSRLSCCCGGVMCGVCLPP